MVLAWFQGCSVRPPHFGCAMLQSKPIKHQQKKETGSKWVLSTFAQFLPISKRENKKQPWSFSFCPFSQYKPSSVSHTFFILRQPARCLPEVKLVRSFPDHGARACLEAEETPVLPQRPGPRTEQSTADQNLMEGFPFLSLNIVTVLILIWKTKFVQPLLFASLRSECPLKVSTLTLWGKAPCLFEALQSPLYFKPQLCM